MKKPGYQAKWMTDGEKSELGWTQNITTLRECSAPDCKLGVRNQYAVLGMCVPHAEGEIERLRGIEKAIKSVTDLPLPRPWHVLAAILREEGLKAWAGIIDAIADALEAKP